MVKGGKEVANSPHVALQFAEEELRDLQMVDDDGRIVTLINIGAHYHNFTFYQQDIEFLMQFLDGLQQRKRHKKDLYFFRTTVSGHNKCHPRRPNDSNIRRNGQRVVPLKSYPDVDRSGPDPYDWFLFEEYNAHVQKRVAATTSGNENLLRILNVYNMTVLRRDGHWGGKDCLHYRPGPQDWWNHLLFTHLSLLSQCSASLAD
jgi:hypothetical protein